MNKQKSRQHNRHEKKYTAQFARTAANKERRAKARARWLKKRQAKKATP